MGRLYKFINNNHRKKNTANQFSELRDVPDIIKLIRHQNQNLSCLRSGIFQTTLLAAGSGFSNFLRRGTGGTIKTRKISRQV